jgi:uncharacterized membrane protein YoaK (UPF0700 family)
MVGALALRSGTRREVTRRAVVLISLVIGAVCSAALLKGAREVAPALPLAITVLVIATALRRLREPDTLDNFEPLA